MTVQREIDLIRVHCVHGMVSLIALIRNAGCSHKIETWDQLRRYETYTKVQFRVACSFNSII